MDRCESERLKTRRMRGSVAHARGHQESDIADVQDVLVEQRQKHKTTAPVVVHSGGNTPWGGEEGGIHPDT